MKPHNSHPSSRGGREERKSSAARPASAASTSASASAPSPFSFQQSVDAAADERELEHAMSTTLSPDARTYASMLSSASAVPAPSSSRLVARPPPLDLAPPALHNTTPTLEELRQQPKVEEDPKFTKRCRVKGCRSWTQRRVTAVSLEDMVAFQPGLRVGDAICEAHTAAARSYATRQLLESQSTALVPRLPPDASSLQCFQRVAIDSPPSRARDAAAQPASAASSNSWTSSYVTFSSPGDAASSIGSSSSEESKSTSSSSSSSSSMTAHSESDALLPPPAGLADACGSSSSSSSGWLPVSEKLMRKLPSLQSVNLQALREPLMHYSRYSGFAVAMLFLLWIIGKLLGII